MLIKQIYPEALYEPSQYCKYFYRAEQATGDMENSVITGALAVKNAGFLDGTLWANSGFATVGANAAYYCTVDNNSHVLDHVNNTIIVTARIKKVAAAYPAAEQYIVASYNPGSVFGGIILSCRTDGSAKLYMNSTDNTTAAITSAVGTLTNGATATERSLVFVCPRNAVSGYVGVDGFDSSSSSFAGVVGKSIAGISTMRIGAPLGGGAIDGYQIAALAAYQVPVDFASINRPQVYDWAYRNPGIPMPDWVFV